MLLSCYHVDSCFSSRKEGRTEGRKERKKEGWEGLCSGQRSEVLYLLEPCQTVGVKSS